MPMPDFYQTGAITTLHRLVKLGLPRLESERVEFSRGTPNTPLLRRNVREPPEKRKFAQFSYLKQIMVGVDGANSRESRPEFRLFLHFPQQPKLVWNNALHTEGLLQGFGACIFDHTRWPLRYPLAGEVSPNVFSYSSTAPHAVCRFHVSPLDHFTKLQ